MNGQSAYVQFVDAATEPFLPKREQLEFEKRRMMTRCARMAGDLTLPRRWCFAIKLVRARLSFGPCVTVFRSSSMAEHSAVNRRVVGSSPTCGANPQSSGFISCRIPRGKFYVGQTGNLGERLKQTNLKRRWDSAEISTLSLLSQIFHQYYITRNGPARNGQLISVGRPIEPEDLLRLEVR